MKHLKFILFFLICFNIKFWAQQIDTLKYIKDTNNMRINLLLDTANLQTASKNSFFIDKTFASANKIDTTSQRILLIGDSMVGGLSYPMQDYCDYNKHTFLAVTWESAQTKWFYKTDTLNFFIKKFKPTFIFILLGANETYITKDFEKKRGKYIEKILKDLDTIPFVWIGPPNWNDDTLLNSVIRKYTGADRFFTSYKVSLNNPDFKHWRDGVHPALSADRIWMDSLAVWLMTKSKYKIKMNKPTEFSEKPKSNLKILKPLPRHLR